MSASGPSGPLVMESQHVSHRWSPLNSSFINSATGVELKMFSPAVTSIFVLVELFRIFNRDKLSKYQFSHFPIPLFTIAIEWGRFCLCLMLEFKTGANKPAVNPYGIIILNYYTPHKLCLCWPANFVCGGYTVFTSSVRLSVRACVRP